MRYNNQPKRTDKTLNFGAWDNINRQTRKLQNVKFGPGFFQFEDNGGLYVDIPATKDVDDFEYHFKAEVTESNVAAGVGTIEFHGGMARRYSNSQVYDIPLSVDGGTSEHYDDVLTWSNVTSNRYFYTILDDPREPNTLSIANTTSDVYPTFDANEYTVKVLGRANVDSGTLIWEPYWTGGDFEIEGLIVDANSTNDATTQRRNYSIELSERTGHKGEAQDYGWANTNSQVLDENDQLVVKTIENEGTDEEIHKKRYCTIADLANSAGFTTFRVVEDIRYDTSTHQLQAKYRNIKIFTAEAAEDWIMITGGQATVCT